MLMEAELSLLRLYMEWGVDTALADVPADHRQSTGHAIGPRTARPAPDDRPPMPGRNGPYAPPTARSGHPAGLADAAGNTHLPRAMPSPMPPAMPGTGPGTGVGTAASIADSVALARQVAARADSPQALSMAMDRFEACPLRATAMHTLVPHGPTHAPLMLIGEAPDADEDRSGQVFAGVCGTLLDEMLAPLPLTRADLLLATALPWRPPGGRPPSDLEQRMCLPFLERAIELFAPQRLLLCGRMPAAMMLGRDSQPRREWQPLALPGLPPLPVLCMRHPLQLRASSTARREIWQSLLLVMQTLRQSA
ncbi:MAG: uracil-DNA glycosylase [Acetobacter sp.]|uniref:uracil-DNA glycosylase n=2 Tax=Acetobacter sp. TaxID=440 RepID=UPI0039E828EB